MISPRRHVIVTNTKDIDPFMEMIMKSKFPVSNLIFLIQITCPNQVGHPYLGLS